MKVLETLFVRLHQLMVSVGNRDIAEFAAIVLMTFTICLNFASILIYTSLFVYKLEFLKQSQLYVFPLYFVLLILFFFKFILQKKYVLILGPYEKESRHSFRKGRVLTILYLVLTLGMVASSLFLMAKNSRGELWWG